jgi:hypothetical protein
VECANKLPGGSVSTRDGSTADGNLLVDGGKGWRGPVRYSTGTLRALYGYSTDTLRALYGMRGDADGNLLVDADVKAEVDDLHHKHEPRIVQEGEQQLERIA